MSQRATWWLAGAGALMTLGLVVGLLTFCFKRDVSSLPARAVAGQAASSIGLSRLARASTAELVVEAALFYDPTPMFLPTEWNSDQNSLPANVLRDPGQMFQDFQARLVFERDALSLNLPDAIVALQKPTDALSGVEDMAKLSGLGARDVRIAPLVRRSGYVEVVATATGRLVYQTSLGMEESADGLWRPLELSGVISAAGVVGQLTGVGSTGGGELDQRIREHLLKSLHLGERLGPGFYRIFVGP